MQAADETLSLAIGLFLYSYSRILVCSSPEIVQVDHCAAHSTYKVKDVRARSILIRPRSRRASAEVE
jgi:hypothetical protein